MSKIEWTEKTWNPVVGCSILSPGCTNCYAMKMAARIETMGSAPHYAGTTKKVNGHAVWTGKLALAPDHIVGEPFQRKKPTMWFVNSMSDLFHEDVPDAWIDRVFTVMALTPHHTYQVLTKRAARMRAYFEAPAKGKLNREGTAEQRIKELHHWGRFDNSPGWKGWPLPNVWLGVSAERQKEANERVLDLLDTPAAVRFVSAEPLLGPIDFTRIPSVMFHNKQPYDVDALKYPDARVDWVIVGGESGRGARPMHPDWARSIRDQCTAAGVAFFFKQWGQWGLDSPHPVSHDAGALTAMTTVASTEKRCIGERSYLAGSGEGKPSTPLRSVGKKTAGRLLDGREWNEMPKAALELAA